MHERPESGGRLPRSFANIFCPIVAILVLFMADYSYVVSNVLPRVKMIESADLQTWNLWVDILTWSLYQILTFLTLWAHLRMLWSDPGHIAYDHYYQTELMSSTDQILYAQLKHYRSQTFVQFEEEGGDFNFDTQGSEERTRSSIFSIFGQHKK